LGRALPYARDYALSGLASIKGQFFRSNRLIQVKKDERSRICKKEAG
jgi:hypothetical protein